MSQQKSQLFIKQSELNEAIKAERSALIRGFLLSLLVSATVFVPTVFMFQVYGKVLDSRSIYTLGALMLAAIPLYIGLEFIQWARSETLREAAHRFDRALSPRVFDTMAQANKNAATAVGLQPVNDLKTIRDFTFSKGAEGILESPAALLFALILYLVNPLLGYVALAIMAVQILLGVLNNRETVPALTAASRSAQEAQRYAENSLRNPQVIEAMGMLRSIQRKWFDKQREFLKQQAVASERAGGFQASTKTLQIAAGSAMMGFSMLILLENALPGGPAMLIVSSILAGRVMAPVAQMVSQWRNVVGAREAFERLDKLLIDFPAPEPSMPLPPAMGKLTVEGVTAGPPGSNFPIIKNINFRLEPGEAVAVVGPSASGKTSLAKVLIGIWPTLSGKVRLDGSDVYLWNKSELGPQIGYLPQSIDLFEGTLAENIRRFGEPNEEALQSVCGYLGLNELAAELPQGYDTPVGIDGQVLSGGQRQRVAIARAIYGNPRLVVLDEPNSSLDEEGDRLLAQMIEAKKSQGTTFVIVTHRTSILKVADKILVLNDGNQAGFGPRDEVLAALRARLASPATTTPVIKHA